MTLVTQKSNPDPYPGIFPAIKDGSKHIHQSEKLTAVFLKATDIDAFLDLQNRVRPTLERKYHLKDRDGNDLETHFATGHAAIGIKTSQGRLVAQCILAFAGKDGVKNLDGYPIADNAKSYTAVVQSVCVDPAFQGQGLSGRLLRKALMTAAGQRCTELVSAIADDNLASKAAFEKAGYKPYDSGKDTVNGYRKTYFKRSVFGCDAA